MKVTKIAAQVKKADRASIFVDGTYMFSLALDQLLESGLRLGSELSESDIATYKKMSDEGKLKARTLDWLMIRPRSSLELRQYLRRKNAEPDLAEAWVVEFANRKYLDDAYFASWWVEQRRRSKQRSSSRIRSELRSKGIASEHIDFALAQEAIDDNHALRALIAKKGTISRYADQTKLIAYLQRQGYRYSDIVEALTAVE